MCDMKFAQRAIMIDLVLSGIFGSVSTIIGISEIQSGHHIICDWSLCVVHNPQIYGQNILYLGLTV